jgi:hypothetical protein
MSLLCTIFGICAQAVSFPTPDGPYQGAGETAEQFCARRPEMSCIHINKAGVFQTIRSGSSATFTVANVSGDGESDKGYTCWIYIGTLPPEGRLETKLVLSQLPQPITMAQASVLLMSRGTYQRSFPYVPSGDVNAACERPGVGIAIIN